MFGHCFFLIERGPIYCPKSFKNKKDIVLANTLKTDGIKWTPRVLDWTQGYQKEIRGFIIAGSLRGVWSR